MTKTIKIDLIKETTNRMLKDSPNDCKDYRQGVINLVDAILMDTRNYKGFRYLSKEEVAPGYTVGVHLTSNWEDNRENLVHDFENTDRTRIQIA